MRDFMNYDFYICVRVGNLNYIDEPVDSYFT